MPEVSLRPIRMTDAEQCYVWVSDPEVARYLGLLQPPLSVEHERSWISSLLTDKAHQRHFVILNAQGRPIGTCGLRGIDNTAGFAHFGILIGNRTDWGQGYGTAATHALLAYGFRELELQEVRLSCHASNRRALRCYEKVGFTLSTHHLERWTFGRAEVRMSITREQWEARQAERAAGQ
jgi:RimJ/RimL family protein N-acetyltransferase